MDVLELNVFLFYNRRGGLGELFFCDAGKETFNTLCAISLAVSDAVLEPKSREILPQLTKVTSNDTVHQRLISVLNASQQMLSLTGWYKRLDIS